MNALQDIVGGIAEFYSFIADKLDDDALRREILIDLGLAPETPLNQTFPQSGLKGINDYRKTINVAQEAANASAVDLGKVLGIPRDRSAKLALPQDSLAALKKFAEAKDPGASEYQDALTHLKKLFDASVAFAKTLMGVDFPDEDDFVQRFYDVAATDYLRVHHPGFYWGIQPFVYATELALQQGGIDVPGPGAVGRAIVKAGQASGQAAIDLPRFLRNNVPKLFQKKTWQQVAHFLADVDDDAEAQLKSDVLFLPLAVASIVLLKGGTKPDDDSFTSLSFEPLYGFDSEPNSPTPAANKILERTLSYRITRRHFKPDPAPKVDEEQVTLTLILVTKPNGGPGLFVSVGAGVKFEIPLGDNWQLKLGTSLGAAFDFFLAFFHISDFDANLPGSGSRPKLTVSIENTGTDPVFTLGKDSGSHLQFGRLKVAGELSSDAAEIKALTTKSELVLDFSKSKNSFLASALSSPKTIPLNFGVGLSKARGLFLEDGKDSAAVTSGPAAPQADPQSEALDFAAGDIPPDQDIPDDAPLERITPVGKTFGPARIQFLSLSVNPSPSAVSLAATISFDLKLAPVTASMDKAGFALTADFGKKKPNLGFFDLEFGFKPPPAIGLEVDAKVVRGGGFLYLDPANSQYGGALHLELSGGIALNAIGLLNTGGSTFSLLIIITATGFKPIPIGFGFLLSGIGGLLGIHRTANEEAIKAGVRNDTLKAVLAPTDLIRNAPQYLSTLSTIFPVAQDHFLFGPVVQITWGVPTLITINLALIFEFGVRTRFLALGQLLSVLPKPDLDLIRLKMNIAGGIDFDRKQAFLDAALFDSRLVNRFVITGEMRMRLNWGDRPLFVLAVGGLHPAFPVPPGLEGMQRLAIIFADSENLKLRCDGYFAITSNTVQFGASVDLFAKKSKFSVEGHVGFDVLIQFDPFHFIAGFRASLQLKAFGRNLFKVSFEGELSGPRPLHAKGKATFEILWWDYSVSFNTTLIEGEKPPLPAPVDVGALLRAALLDASSWSAELPAGGTRLVSLRETASAGVVRLHPLGVLTVKQKVTPLNLRITRFGSTVPKGGPQEFRVTAAKIGTVTTNNPDTLRDHFAPAQFLEMTDSEKLSGPSFALLPGGLRMLVSPPVSGPAVKAAASYEEKQLPAPPSPPPRRPTFTLTGGTFTRLNRWSAVAGSNASLPEANRYHFKPVAMPVPGHTYTVASQENPDAALATFATRVEAVQTLKRQPSPRTLQIITRQN